MNRASTLRLIELLQALEEYDGLIAPIDSYLPIDDPTAPAILTDIGEAILSLDGVIPVFRRGHDERYLGFSRYLVTSWMINQIGDIYRSEHHHIQTSKGLILFPEYYRVYTLRALKPTDITMRHKESHPPLRDAS